MGWAEGQGKQGQGKQEGYYQWRGWSSWRGGEACEANDEDEESHVEGCYEVEESCRQIQFERKRRNASEGDYGTKPPKDARPTVEFLQNNKGLLRPKPKKTLRHIVRLKWDEHTLNTKGAKREAFYDSCVKVFKDYYAYPKDYEPEDGDRVVRTHLKRNFKSYLNSERARPMKEVDELVKIGYDRSVIKIKTLKPYYYSQKAWNAICEHWEAEDFVGKSEKGHYARKKVEFTPAQRREEKMKMVRSSQPELTLESHSDQPPSPYTQKEILRKKDLFVMMEARPPKKGKLLLHPQETMGELIGAQEATQWAKQTMEKSRAPAVDVPDDIYMMMMSTILDEVWQIVISLPPHEVKRSVLDEKIRNLAVAAYPDPSQQSLQVHYIRTTNGLFRQVSKNTNKFIVEETQLDKAVDMAVEVHKTVEVDKTMNNEDEDLNAHNYPLL